MELVHFAESDAASADVEALLGLNQSWLVAQEAPKIRAVCCASSKESQWLAARDLLDSDPMPFVQFDAFGTQRYLAKMLSADFPNVRADVTQLPPQDLLTQEMDPKLAARMWQVRRIFDRIYANEGVFNSVVRFARRTLQIA